jgi:ATP phosphoribosyltransferase regulatory subunit
MLDLGLIGRHNYYTGAVYEVYAAGLGFTVANGGRYDNLLRRFGEPLPATGFAISLERLISVLPEKKPSPALVLIGAGVEVTRVATELRSSGVPVLHLAEDLALEAAFAYARSVEAAWVAYPAPEGLKLAPVRAGGEFELTPTEKVAGRVLS